MELSKKVKMQLLMRELAKWQQIEFVADATVKAAKGTTDQKLQSAAMAELKNAGAMAASLHQQVLALEIIDDTEKEKTL